MSILIECMTHIKADTHLQLDYLGIMKEMFLHHGDLQTQMASMTHL